MVMVLGLLMSLFWLWMIIDFFQHEAFDEDFWAAAVFLGPVGAVIYFFGFFLPRTRHATAVHSGSRQLKELEAQGMNHLPAGRLRELGDIYFHRMRWTDALMCYQRALPALPDQHAMRLDMAACLLELGRTKEAFEPLQTVLRSGPFYRERAATLLAEMAAKAPEFHSVLNEIGDIVRTSTSLRLKYYYAICLANIAQRDEARKLLEEIQQKAATAIRDERKFARLARKLSKSIKLVKA